MSAKPILHNVRILDFTRVLAGPYATRLLADFGAEVIKVQPPGLPEREDEFARKYDKTWNRNKRGITLNMNKPEGIGLAKKLIGISDAVVENFTPRVMENWGLDYVKLKKIKPDIIMVSMSAMGQQNPHRDYTGYAPTVQALSGLTALTSFPGKAPAGPGFSYADHIAGLYASLGLLAALEARNKTGQGQHIDISEVAVLQGLLKEKDLKQAPDGVYQCKDGKWAAVSIITEEDWGGLKRVMGSPAWAEETRFKIADGRQKNRGELEERLTAWARWFTAAELTALLQSNHVPAGRVQDAADIAKDRQLKARGFFVKKGVLTDASPIKMDNVKAAYKRKAPAAGQDNAYVYGKLLGLSQQEMAALKETGVI
jgi:crotonobetainyl-CoA:carnitine CoA-transferase CaiB-like acyl-CoA transferase